MSLIKLKRMEIQVQKEKELKKLSDMDGAPVKHGQVPDYIDPEFAKQKYLYRENNDISENINKNNQKKRNSTKASSQPKKNKDSKSVKSSNNGEIKLSSKSIKKEEMEKGKEVKSKFHKAKMIKK